MKEKNKLLEQYWKRNELKYKQKKNNGSTETKIQLKFIRNSFNM
jgi:hypothetical protein